MCEDLTVTVTYTDVHPERLAFFQDMLKPRGVMWESQRTATLAAGAPFYLATGARDAADEAGCRSYLDFLGSRLVFLIDWNRARKQLRQFLRGPDRLALLLWAAENEIGHRGFLELGGARLVNQAIEAAAGSSMHFGDRLCDVLGDAETQAFLRFVFRTATEGLLSGTSQALIHDRIRVDARDPFQQRGAAASAHRRRTMPAWSSNSPAWCGTAMQADAGRWRQAGKTRPPFRA